MSGNHVGPIIFANETARTQLVEEGEVVTFRTSKRTTGETHWRTERTGKKQGDVIVKEIGEVDLKELEQLEPYGPQSGFQSIREWQLAILSLNDSLESGYLYRARLPTANKEVES